ncbi:hypothetical protein Aam_053_012 [Acidocella aminolytica 101 = DSM 11237]|uniref:Uncharacterized protein n=1 Tax=Acidocella aminolytica 101 = DSM 11237 TaxID=1120923 RepID=A0A0D6PH80_9PROT|nr:hypothetical protein Aam_053_012 [Acidocella aminolytica 101 = DSM 11237]
MGGNHLAALDRHEIGGRGEKPDSGKFDAADGKPQSEQAGQGCNSSLDIPHVGKQFTYFWEYGEEDAENNDAIGYQRGECHAGKVPSRLDEEPIEEPVREESDQ